MIANKGSSSSSGKSMQHQISLSEDNVSVLAQINGSHPISTSLLPIIKKDRRYSLEKHFLNFTNVSSYFIIFTIFLHTINRRYYGDPRL